MAGAGAGPSWSRQNFDPEPEPPKSRAAPQPWKILADKTWLKVKVLPDSDKLKRGKNTSRQNMIKLKVLPDRDKLKRGKNTSRQNMIKSKSPTWQKQVLFLFWAHCLCIFVVPKIGCIFIHCSASHAFLFSYCTEKWKQSRSFRKMDNRLQYRREPHANTQVEQIEERKKKTTIWPYFVKYLTSTCNLLFM